MAISKPLSIQPDELYTKIMVIAKQTGAPFSNVVCDLITKGLEALEREKNQGPSLFEQGDASQDS